MSLQKSTSNLARSLYRILLKQATAWLPVEQEIRVIRPFDTDAWLLKAGSPVFLSGDKHTSGSTIVDGLPDTVTRDWLRKEIRARFRSGDGDVSQALAAIKALDGQRFLSSRTVRQTTREVEISVMAAYVGDQRELDELFDDDPGPSRYLYSYRISIANVRCAICIFRVVCSILLSYARLDE